MITIVPSWLWSRIKFETIELSWLVIIVDKERSFVYKDRYATNNQRFIDTRDIPKLVDDYIKLGWITP